MSKPDIDNVSHPHPHSENNGEDDCESTSNGDCEWEAGCAGDGSCCGGACMEEQDGSEDDGSEDDGDKSAYIPGDLVLTLYRRIVGQDDPMFITVSVVEGEAPWATCRCGRVVTGPPNAEFILPCCGVSEGTLPWNDGNYWVLDSIDEDGDPTTLTPSEYREMLVTAASTPPAMQVF